MKPTCVLYYDRTFHLSLFIYHFSSITVITCCLFYKNNSKCCSYYTYTHTFNMYMYINYKYMFSYDVRMDVSKDVACICYPKTILNTE